METNEQKTAVIYGDDDPVSRHCSEMLSEIDRLHRAAAKPYRERLAAPSEWSYDLDSAPSRGTVLLAVRATNGNETRTFVAEWNTELKCWYITSTPLGWSRISRGWRPYAWRRLPEL